MLLSNTNLISVNDAAGMLGVTVGRIRQLLIAKKLSGEKLTERAWAVDINSVRDYAATDRKPGPKS